MNLKKFSYFLLLFVFGCQSRDMRDVNGIVKKYIQSNVSDTNGLVIFKFSEHTMYEDMKGNIVEYSVLCKYSINNDDRLDTCIHLFVMDEEKEVIKIEEQEINTYGVTSVDITEDWFVKYGGR